MVDVLLNVHKIRPGMVSGVNVNKVSFSTPAVVCPVILIVYGTLQEESVFVLRDGLETARDVHVLLVVLSSTELVFFVISTVFLTLLEGLAYVGLVGLEISQNARDAMLHAQLVRDF